MLHDSLCGRLKRREQWNAHVQRVRRDWRNATVVMDVTSIEREVRSLVRLTIFARLNILCAGVLVSAQQMEQRLAILAR
jgi:hypothetical protein